MAAIVANINSGLRPAALPDHEHALWLLASMKKHLPPTFLTDGDLLLKCQAITLIPELAYFVSIPLQLMGKESSLTFGYRVPKLLLRFDLKAVRLWSARFGIAWDHREELFLRLHTQHSMPLSIQLRLDSFDGAIIWFNVHPAQMQEYRYAIVTFMRECVEQAELEE